MAALIFALAMFVLAQGAAAGGGPDLQARVHDNFFSELDSSVNSVQSGQTLGDNMLSSLQRNWGFGFQDVGFRRRSP